MATLRPGVAPAVSSLPKRTPATSKRDNSETFRPQSEQMSHRSARAGGSEWESNPPLRGSARSQTALKAAQVTRPESLPHSALIITGEQALGKRSIVRRWWARDLGAEHLFRRVLVSRGLASPLAFAFYSHISSSPTCTKAAARSTPRSPRATESSPATAGAAPLPAARRCRTCRPLHPPPFGARRRRRPGEPGIAVRAPPSEGGSRGAAAVRGEGARRPALGDRAAPRSLAPPRLPLRGHQVPGGGCAVVPPHPALGRFRNCSAGDSAARPVDVRCPRDAGPSGGRAPPRHRQPSSPRPRAGQGPAGPTPLAGSAAEPRSRSRAAEGPRGRFDRKGGSRSTRRRVTSRTG
jgi:hypothetical protein